MPLRKEMTKPSVHALPLLQEDMGVCMSQLSTVMEELGRLKALSTRLEMLEQSRPEMQNQADQEHDDGKEGRD